MRTGGTEPTAFHQRTQNLCLMKGRGPFPGVELVFQGIRLEIRQGQEEDSARCSFAKQKSCCYQGFFKEPNSFFFSSE